MQGFLIQFVFEHEGTFDESIQMIHADSTSDAMLKAEKIAIDELRQTEHLGWQYVGIKRLTCLAEISDGQEIISFERNEHVPERYAEYIRSLHFELNEAVYRLQ